MKKLLLCFAIGEDRFALETAQIIEVIPLVQLRKIHDTPECMAGIMRYHGQAVPVVDLCILNIGSPAKRLLSTRIILVRCLAKDGLEHIIGLLAERVTETMRYDSDAFVSPGLSPKGALYMGKVNIDDKEVIQLMDVNNLYSESLNNIVFQHEEGL